MKRDDLRALDPHHRAEESFRRAFNATRPVTDAEALDAIGREAALRHWLTEPCPDCGGRGWHDAQPEFDAEVDCDTCEGRGWVLIDGVRVRTELDDSARGYRETLVVPVSMLEGNDT